MDIYNNPLTKLFATTEVVYEASPYCYEPQYIRLVTAFGINYQYVMELFQNSDSVLSFLQRHMFRYFCEILPKINDYSPPIFSIGSYVNNITTPAIANNDIDDLVFNNNRTIMRINHPPGNSLVTVSTTNPDEAIANLSPFMIYLNSIQIDRLIHMHPLSLFDCALVNSNIVNLFYMQPTQIVPTFREFVSYYRAILFEILYEYAKSDECQKLFQNNPRKLKVKTVCHAEYFTSKRQTPPEFKCVASSADACPHINENILPNGKVPLQPGQTLCTFLIQKYIQDYPDYNQINSVLKFRCRFQDQKLQNNKNVAKERIYGFYNIFSKTNNIHRMCLPDRYLSVDWLKWALSLIQI